MTGAAPPMEIVSSNAYTAEQERRCKIMTDCSRNSACERTLRRREEEHACEIGGSRQISALPDFASAASRDIATPPNRRPHKRLLGSAPQVPIRFPTVISLMMPFNALRSFDNG
jgi:hypothetical protein